MSTTKFEHVIGRDGKVRIRKTCVENGQIIGNTHEGMSDHRETRNSECRNFEACLELIGCGSLAKTFGDLLFAKLIGLPTVDERVRSTGINRRSQCCNADADDLGDGEHFQCQKCRRECSTMTVDERVQADPPDEWNDCRDSKPQYREPEADPLRHERVFGKPADPFEPQTPGPVEPQLR